MKRPCKVADGESRLETAAKSLQMAWHVILNKLTEAELRKSLLGTRRCYMSTSCTGVYTAEVGLALIEKMVNESGALGTVRLEPASCHDTSLAHGRANNFIFYKIYIIICGYFIPPNNAKPHLTITKKITALFLFQHSISDLSKEMDNHCRQCIQDNHTWVNSWSPRQTCIPHIFGNILHQVDLPPIATQSSAKNRPRHPFKVRKDAILKKPLKERQWCFSHGRNCKITDDVDFDFSGLPCQDNSRANFARLFFEGPNSNTYIVWAKKHLQLRTPVLLLENTPVTLILHQTQFLFSWSKEF